MEEKVKKREEKDFETMRNALRDSIKIVGERGPIEIAFNDDYLSVPKECVGQDGITACVDLYSNLHPGVLLYKAICTDYPHLRLYNVAGKLRTASSGYRTKSGHYKLIRVILYHYPQIEEFRLSNKVPTEEEKQDMIKWFGGKLTEKELFE